MPNDSSTGGYIVPFTQPAYDASLEDIIQGAIVGITQLSGANVRPRYQPEPPNQLDQSSNWVAFSVSVINQDQFPYQTHSPTTGVNGADIFQRDEWLELYLSFYGPMCSAYMGLFRDGLSIEQNRWVLYQSGIKLIETQQPTYLPALLKEKWAKRVDLKMTLSRRITTTIPILTVTGANGTLDNERYVTPLVN